MFLAEGAKVAICGRSAERMESAQSQLLSFGEKADIFASTCDVTSKSDVDSFINGTAERFGGIDILVNAAGQSVMGHFFEITDEQWEEQIQLKFFAIIYAVRASHPHIVKKGEAADY
ncbi:SDR family NAD(P)-dependent oxidoreductase [Peribacillus frigoritolerans]|nr:SDR family NAD(P)-dependent oxidoreductase [Peribacillus frigoritolerans]